MNNLNILYEDNHIIVAIKPYNVLSQADNTKDIDMLSLIKKYLKEKYNKPGNVYLGLVHRLDRPTSGVMVFAKTSKAAKRLSESIKNNELTKEYTLVCHGKLNNNGIMEDYIDKKDKKSFISKNGKYASLEYTLLKYNKEMDLSLVKVKLNTGRHHQIRVQFASRSHPLYGDNLYGRGEQTPLCLTATKLEFFHPVKKDLMTFNYDIDYSMEGYSFFK